MTQPRAEPKVSAASEESGRLPCTNTALDEGVLSDLDQFHLEHVMWDNKEGWASELQCYLKELPADVTKDTDIIEWWQVQSFLLNFVLY